MPYFYFICCKDLNTICELEPEATVVLDSALHPKLSLISKLQLPGFNPFNCDSLSPEDHKYSTFPNACKILVSNMPSEAPAIDSCETTSI